MVRMQRYWVFSISDRVLCQVGNFQVIFTVYLRVVGSNQC